MQGSDYGFLVGREYASLSSGGFIPCCQHLFWWVLVWSTYNFSDVSELPYDNAIFCCWDVVEDLSYSFVRDSFFLHLYDSDLEYSSDASVPEDFQFGYVGATECP